MLTLARRLPFRPSLISDAIVRSVTGPLVGGITPAPLVDIVITLTGNGTVVEGSEYTMNIAASGDDAGTISAYEIDWGDETVEAGSAGDNTHTYADGLNSYTIRVAATHTAGVKRKNKALTVTNVAPVAALSGASTAYVDVEYTVTIGSVTDPGDDTITNYRINWGDGSYDDYASIGAKTHTYTSAEASVDITLDITDEDGTHTAVDTLNIEVSAAVVPLFSRDYSAGTLGANATFARSSSATIVDHEGVIRTVPSGAARFNGLRYVRNLLVQPSNAPFTATFGNNNVTVDSPNQITFLYSNSRVFLSGVVGISLLTYRVRAKIRSLSGNRKIRFDNGWFNDLATDIELTNEWLVVTGFLRDPNPDHNQFLGFTVNGTTGNAYPFSIEVDDVQVELVEGQTNQNPSEYVSVGVLSAPYHGANVDGIKYFATENGNSVVGNVVTEGTGAAITGGYLLMEPAATNQMPYSKGFQGWISSGTVTATENYGIAPSGTSESTRVNASAGSWTWHDDATVMTAGQNYTVSAYVRRVGASDQTFRLFGNGNLISGNLTATSEWTRVSYGFTAASGSLACGLTRDTAANACDIEFAEYNVTVGGLSSPIQTSGSAVTRAAESLSYSGIAADNETRAITDAGTVDTDDWDGIVDATINGADNLAQISSITVYTTGERPA